VKALEVWLRQAAFIAGGLFVLCYAWRPLPAFLWPEVFGHEYVRLAVGDTSNVGLMLRWVFIDVPVGSGVGIALALKGLMGIAVLMNKEMNNGA
jgi:hypothetical protein